MTQQEPKGPARRVVRPLLAALGIVVSLQGSALACTGDCNGDGQVTVGEVIRMVNVALGEITGVEACPAADTDRDGNVDIREILQAVQNVLEGCPPVVTSCNDAGALVQEPLCELDLSPRPCDFLIPEHCLLPFPSSTFLRADASSPTGFRMNYLPGALPRNGRGVPIDPTDWNTLDGFSPGSAPTALFPEGVDLVASDVPTILDIARSLEADSPTVLLDATTGERIPHFTELDETATADATRALLVRPGLRLKEGHRYVVAIRGLRDRSGQTIEPDRAFRLLRDGETTIVRTIEDRRPALESVFASLAEAGVDRANLQLAWDFVIASSEALTGRALAARDRALAANGPGAPPFEVVSVEDNYSERIFRRVRGRFTVPLFLNRATPPASFVLDDNGLPRQNGTTTVPFTVIIPRIAVEGEAPVPGRAMVYGHGLFGTGEGEVTASPQQSLASRFGFIIGATDWIGMASEDVPNVLRIVGDFSRFPQMADRLQQSFLNFLFLARLMTAPDGLNSHPAFQFDGAGIIEPGPSWYHGNSQGGIQGAAFLALATETPRGVLGVGASNYSLLLQRSVDFAPFDFVMRQAYPDELDRAVLFHVIQQLWDRGEPNGYASRLLDNPLPGTPAKQVLIQIGIHDSQVSHYATEIQVRSLGIPAMAPSAYPSFGIEEREAPFEGSAWIPFDVGGTPLPLTNTPPLEENGVHEAVRRLDAAQRQIDAFLRPDGRVENFCDGPCVFTGVPGVR